MTFQGTLTEVNAALDGLKYRGAGNFNGADAMSFTTDGRRGSRSTARVKTRSCGSPCQSGIVTMVWVRSASMTPVTAFAGYQDLKVEEVIPSMVQSIGGPLATLDTTRAV